MSKACFSTEEKGSSVIHNTNKTRIGQQTKHVLDNPNRSSLLSSWTRMGLWEPIERE